MLPSLSEVDLDGVGASIIFENAEALKYTFRGNWAGELVYEGELMGGEPDGHGTESLPSGDVYVGDFSAGKR